MQLEDEPKEKCLKEKCVPGVWEGSRPLVFENSYRSLQHWLLERRRKWKGVKYDVALFLKIVPKNCPQKLSPCRESSDPDVELPPAQ